MLRWNVYCDDFNEKRIRTFNIFDHWRFREDCQKIAKKYTGREDPVGDKAKFSEEIKRSLMYYYWSKCEWEIILDSWPERKDFRQEKIDVYDQVALNWDVFINWLWDNRKELRKKVKD